LDGRPPRYGTYGKVATSFRPLRTFASALLLRNLSGFFKILDAVAVLESAGFGFGKPGSKYEYDAVAARTRTDSAVNTISIA
jgi:hypothetical protein